MVRIPPGRGQPAKPTPPDQAKLRTDLAESRVQQAISRAEAAETRTEQAEHRIESAKTRTEQAETRTEQAETRTEQAETRAEQAETRTEQAETRAEQAETRAEQAENRAERAENRAKLCKTTLEAQTGMDPDLPKEGPAARLPAAHSGGPIDLRHPINLLTTRQRQILLLIAQGQNTKQIAGLLQLSPKTVEYHRLKLMAALNVHDIPGLVRLALRVGLIRPDS
jgi:DNA-binding CsgD family transcriptional regulator